MVTEPTAVVGVFSSRVLAERTIEDLRRAGFSDECMGFVMRDQPANGATVVPTEEQTGGAPEAAGAVTGGVIGGIVGAAAALLIPGLGPAIAGGILIPTLGGAALGAATGTLLTALTGMGVSEEEAKEYEQALEAGHAVVIVQADERYHEAFNIMRSHQAEEARGREPDPSAASPYQTGALENDTRAATPLPNNAETR